MISDADALSHLRLALELSGVTAAHLELPTRRVSSGADVELSYLDWGGPEAAPPVLFLHGGGLNAHTWDVVCLALRDRYRCVALDQRGHGESGWSETGDYARERQVSDIDTFISDLGLVRPVIVGMSLGGLNTIAYAAGRRDLAGIVLVDVGPEFEMTPVEQLLEFMSSGVEPTPREEFIARALRFNPRRNRTLLEVSVLRNIRENGAGLWTWKYDPRAAVSGSPEQLRDANLRLWPAVNQISCPVLVVRGAESRMFRQHHAERLVERLADATLEIVPDAGHTVQGDNPAGLVAVLEPFLDRVAPRDR